MRAEPLLQFYPHCRFHGRRPSAWRDAAYQFQPVLTILVQIGLALDVGFHVKGKKEMGRSFAQGVAEKPRGSDSHYHKGLLIAIESATVSRRTRPISPLP